MGRSPYRRVAEVAVVGTGGLRAGWQQDGRGLVVVLDNPAEVAGWDGVGSIVLASDPLGHFALAVEEAAQGRVWVSDAVAPLLPEIVAARPPVALLMPRLSEGLTPTEAETLSMVLSGRSNAEIGSERAVSVNTVKSCVRAVLRKLGCSRRQDLFALALVVGARPDSRVSIFR